MLGRIHRAAERSFVPWKNGGGETAEALCHPLGADTSTFEWRISTARVEADGPFSSFPGIDRVMSILEGGPLRLDFPGRTFICDARSGPLAFAADVPCGAELRGPPILNLNVMVRRPLRAQVRAAPATATRNRRAGYIFALSRCLGLERHDLAEWDGPAPAAPALLIEII